MATFSIEGGHPISGTLDPATSKNAVLPAIAATLLTDETCYLQKVPGISDARLMHRLLINAGAHCDITNEGHNYTITAKHIHNPNIDKDLSNQMRASCLLIGPLLVRLGSVKGYYPGGDKIGLRSLDAHFDGCRQSGYIVDDHKEEGYFEIYKDVNWNKEDYEVALYEPGCTPTENIIMLNVLGKGTVRITNAASEPQIQDLCDLLNAMGAKITGIGTNSLTIEKVEKLHGARHTIAVDYVYISSFIIFALVTNGDLYIKNVIYQDLIPTLRVLKYFNVVTEMVDKTTLHILPNQDFRKREDYDIFGNIGIYSQPWPMLPSDILPFLVILGCLAEGDFLFFEKMYADRIKYTQEIVKLGASIKLLDQHRVLVHGKTPLHGGVLTCPDIRTGILYLAAMLSANNSSTLYNIQHIERAYPKIEDVLTQLGANIKKYEESTQKDAS